MGDNSQWGLLPLISLEEFMSKHHIAMAKAGGSNLSHFAAYRNSFYSQAKDDFNAVIAMISTARVTREADPDDARSAIAELVKLERETARVSPNYRAKRLILRQLQKAGVYAAYGRMRIRQRIAKTTRAS